MRYQTAPLPGHPSLRPFPSASDANIRSHAGGIGIAKVLPLRRAKADWGIRVAAEGQGPARLLLPAVSLSLCKEHSLANRQRYIDQAAVVKRRLRHERTLALIEYFRTHPCVQCGEPDPVVLEFDHVRDKGFDIGQNLLDYRWEAIVEEIEKCEVVCANCHRRRTAQRRGAVRVVLTQGDGDERAGDRA